MSLEEELITELSKQGNGESDIREIVTYLQDPTFSRFKPIKLNNKKIDTILKRREILKKYSSQKWSNRKRRKKYFNELVREKIERLKENPFILSASVKRTLIGDMNCSCNGVFANYKIRTKEIKELKDGSYIKFKGEGDSFFLLYEMWKRILIYSNNNFFKLKFLIHNMVNAKIVQFRRGRHVVHEKHFLIEIDGVQSSKDAEKFIGKEVVWKSPAGKAIEGKISSTHGNKGVVRAIFEKGLPGQAVATKVEIK